MIAVVGGGFTGLALGLELERRGLDFVVLEAGDRPGGVIRSARLDGRVLDWGPQRLRLGGDMARLVDAVGLSDELVLAPGGLGLSVYRRGRLLDVPMSLGAFWLSDAVGTRAKLRALLEPLTRGTDPDESVASYFVRKLGLESYETLVGPLFGGLYASDPADMDVDTALAPVLARLGVRRSLLAALVRAGGVVHPAPAATFRDGMEALPQAMARQLGDRVRTGAPVVSLARSGAGWTLVLDHEMLEAEAVVLTTPAPAAAALLRTCAPALARAAGGLRYNPLAVVHLEARTDLEGFGFQVALSEPGLALRGVTFQHSLFARRDLYTAFLGGARAPWIAGQDDEAVGARAAADFGTCTGSEARVLAVHRTRVPAWDRSWRALADAPPLPSGLHIATTWSSRPGLPGRLADAGHTASVLSGEPAAHPGGHSGHGAAGSRRP